MKKIYNNKDQKDEQFFNHIDVKWKKSKDEIWDEVFDNIEEDNDTNRASNKTKTIFVYSAAAIIILLFGIGLFLRFYTENVYVPAGNHLSYILPDNSQIQLNAETKISYNPYWWKYKRQLNLEGEAYFEVKKGSDFTVISKKGITSVLGTSFNIKARQNDYQVSCFTGKVAVANISKTEKVILNPKQQAIITNNGELKTNTNTENDILQQKAWIENKFYFTNENLKNVFDELSRQFDIKISYPKNLNQKYTGNFTKELTLDEILNLICLPFELEYSINQKIISISNK